MNETEHLKDSNNILYIDVGNSLIKIKIFKNSTWLDLLQILHDDLSKLEDYYLKNSALISGVVISSVVSETCKRIREIIAPLQPVIIDIRDIPQKKLNYDTPETLGIDRFLACYGGYKKSHKTVVVIDAGTACTIDCMDHNGVFQGGMIMPGLRILEDGLHHFAPALPVVGRKIPDQWPGKSTRKSLQWGITGIFMDAITKALERYQTEYGSFSLWLTGGDAHLIEEYLTIPVNLDPNLVFEGMRYFQQDN